MTTPRTAPTAAEPTAPFVETMPDVIAAVRGAVTAMPGADRTESAAIPEATTTASLMS
ncbi:hypothetical protein K4X33_06545 [Brevibacterium casei]|nr:hypothetical protein K4X33_06545 [Brevibacterium casei]